MNKIFKVFLCLIISFVFLYAQPKQEMEKAEAVVPLLLGILGSVVLDIAVDAGFAFADKQMAKKKADDIAGKLWKKHSKTLKDLKPTKKNIGKWALKLPAFLIAEIVDLWTDEAENVKDNDDDDDGVPPEYKPDDFNVTIEGSTVVTDPYYRTGGSVTLDIANSDPAALTFWAKYGGRIEIVPEPFRQGVKMYACVGTQSCESNWTWIFPNTGYSGFEVIFTIGSIHVPESNPSSGGISVRYKTPRKCGEQNQETCWSNGEFYWLGGSYGASWLRYMENLRLGGKKIYQYQGMVIARNHIDSYIRFDNDVLTSEQLQKIDWSKLRLPSGYDDREFEFDFDFSNHTDIQNDNEFEWELVEGDVQTKIDNGTIYNDYDFNYEPTINNNYVLTKAQREALDKQINIIINNDVDVGSGDGGQQCVEGGKVVPCKDVEKIDGSLLAYVRNAYDYAVNAIATAVDGLKKLGKSVVGLIDLYKTFMSWLPMEIQTLMYSSLAIMVGLRIFRK